MSYRDFHVVRILVLSQEVVNHLVDLAHLAITVDGGLGGLNDFDRAAE